MTAIRELESRDRSALWAILKPIFRAGDSYTVPAAISETAAMNYWTGGDHESFVVEDAGKILGSYFICAIQQGGGNHVCNCGFAVSPEARGKGLARKLLEHALNHAVTRGFKAMQFNFVVATNLRAIEIWKDYGFKTVGRLPKAFNHPTEGFVDAFVMYKLL